MLPCTNFTQVVPCGHGMALSSSKVVYLPLSGITSQSKIYFGLRFQYNKTTMHCIHIWFVGSIERHASWASNCAYSKANIHRENCNYKQIWIIENNLKKNLCRQFYIWQHALQAKCTWGNDKVCEPYLAWTIIEIGRFLDAPNSKVLCA